MSKPLDKIIHLCILLGRLKEEEGKMFSRRIVPFNIWKLVFPVPPMRIGADELKRAKTEKFFTNKKESDRAEENFFYINSAQCMF